MVFTKASWGFIALFNSVALLASYGREVKAVASHSQKSAGGLARREEVQVQSLGDVCPDGYEFSHHGSWLNAGPILTETNGASTSLEQCASACTHQTGCKAFNFYTPQSGDVCYTYDDDSLWADRTQHADPLSIACLKVLRTDSDADAFAGTGVAATTTTTEAATDHTHAPHPDIPTAPPPMHSACRQCGSFIVTGVGMGYDGCYEKQPAVMEYVRVNGFTKLWCDADYKESLKRIPGGMGSRWRMGIHDSGIEAKYEYKLKGCCFPPSGEWNFHGTNDEEEGTTGKIAYASVGMECRYTSCFHSADADDASLTTATTTAMAAAQ